MIWKFLLSNLELQMVGLLGRRKTRACVLYCSSFSKNSLQFELRMLFGKAAFEQLEVVRKKFSMFHMEQSLPRGNGMKFNSTINCVR